MQITQVLEERNLVGVLLWIHHGAALAAVTLADRALVVNMGSVIAIVLPRQKNATASTIRRQVDVIIEIRTERFQDQARVEQINLCFLKAYNGGGL